MKDRFGRMGRPVLISREPWEGSRTLPRRLRWAKPSYVHAKALAALAALAATCGTPAIAFAQQFEKVEGLPRQEIPAGPFVAGAYGFIWAAVLVYVFVIARGLARVERDIADLSRKLEGKLESTVGSRDRAG